MAWLSPSYPVGAFSYSSGIEWAVEAGDIRDAATLQDWLARDAGGGRRLLRRGVVRARAPARPRATLPRSPRSPSLPRRSRRRRSATWKPPRRAAPSSTPRARRGRAPRSNGWRALPDVAFRSRWRRPAPATASRSSRRSPPICMRRRRHSISAGVRLIPLGQTDGQRVLARSSRGRRARHRALDDIGARVPRRLASMRHETQYTRLFRSFRADIAGDAARDPIHAVCSGC